MKGKSISKEQILKIEEITNQGMNGQISFLSSLESRLNLVPISKTDLQAFARSVTQFITPGLPELIQRFKSIGVEIWIVSGALRDLLIPVAKQLGIPEKHLLGIDLEWTSEGLFNGIDATIPAHRSKWEGAQTMSQKWVSPRIAVGDGVTDYALYEHRLVDHFIAFTQNVRRQVVLDRGVPEAKDVAELRLLIEGFLNG